MAIPWRMNKVESSTLGLLSCIYIRSAEPKYRHRNYMLLGLCYVNCSLYGDMAQREVPWLIILH